MATTATITSLTTLSSVQTDDVLPIVDVHDTSQAPSGSTKKVTVATLLAGYLTTSSAASTYLPLSGGTLTGGLTGTTAAFSGTLAAGGITLGSVSGQPRILYGSSSPTAFSVLTAANGYADFYANAATLAGAFAHTGTTFGAFGATPHVKQTISGGLSSADGYAQALGIVLQTLGLVTLNNTSGTITVTG